MSELTVPKEWTKINISEIADVDLGKTPKKKDYRSDGLYKVVKFRDVGYEGIDWSKNKDGFVLEDTTKDLRRLELDDVLITASAHSSEHIGRKICFVNRIPKNYKNVFYCGELLGIRAYKDILSPKFTFLYFLSHSGYKEIQSRVKGVHLTSGQARNMTVPFAPYEEQGQIIEIVEELFSDLDNAIENLQKAKGQLKVYRQSVLKYAFEGKLSSVNQKPKFTKLSELTILITKGASPKWQGIKYVSDSSQVLFVTSENVRDNTLDVSSPKYVELKFNEKQKRSILVKGDVLLNIVGASIGRATIFDLAVLANINQAVSVIRCKESLCNKYLSYFLNSVMAFNFYSSKKVDVARPNISLTDVSNIPVPYFEFDLQQQIVQEIESRFSVCDKMEETINNSLEQAEALRQSILKQAFEGKLTEEWRKNNSELISGENSAKVLLERIKKEREALKNIKKRKK